MGSRGVSAEFVCSGIASLMITKASARADGGGETELPGAGAAMEKVTLMSIPMTCTGLVHGTRLRDAC